MLIEREKNILKTKCSFFIKITIEKSNKKCDVKPLHIKIKLIAYPNWNKLILPFPLRLLENYTVDENTEPETRSAWQLPLPLASCSWTNAF